MYRSRNYRRRKYYKSQKLSPAEMLIEIIAGLIYFVLKQVFSLLSWTFKQIYKSATNAHFSTNSSAINTLVVKESFEERSEIIETESVIPEQKELKINLESSLLTQTEGVISERKEQKYNLKPSLLTQTEKDFYTVLKNVVGDRYQIIPQVLLTGIMKVHNSRFNYTNYPDFNRIKAKSIDFILYDADFKPYLAIELDDYTHLQKSRIKRDDFVDEIMEEVGLRILHVPVTHQYDIGNLRSVIFQTKDTAIE